MSRVRLLISSGSGTERNHPEIQVSGYKWRKKTTTGNLVVVVCAEWGHGAEPVRLVGEEGCALVHGCSAQVNSGTEKRTRAGK